jgi:hypothetical protein
MNVPVSATKPAVLHEPRFDPKTAGLTHQFRSVSLPKPLRTLQSEYPLFDVLTPGLHQNPQVDALEQIVVVDYGNEIGNSFTERGAVSSRLYGDGDLVDQRGRERAEFLVAPERCPCMREKRG